MNNQDKIFELLQKENLTEEEKSLLEQWSKEDADALKIVSIYKKLNNVISSSSHLSYDEIGDYILFRNDLTPENKIVVKLVSRIEDHLRSCPKCSGEFKKLNEEFSNIETFVGSELNKQKAKATSPLYYASKVKFNIYRYVLLTFVALGILYGIMFTISKVTTPAYFDLAAINNKTDFYTTRGRATGDFLNSLNALDDGKVNKAINYLNSDIKNHPDDKTIFYSYYILGLTYLDNADRRFIGLFPHYNSYYAEQAAINFQNAIQKNNSGNYRNVTLDAYFYLAKANIMMDKMKDAREELMTVVSEKGSKMDEAKHIMKRLE